MSLWVPRRIPSSELLDGEVSSHDARESLADIEWVHRHFGGASLVRRRILPLLASLPSPRSLLDLGSGSGHVGRDVVSAARAGGFTVTVFDLDCKLAHVKLSPRGTAAAAEALALPFGDRSVDIVFSTLFVHHFSPDDLSLLAAEAGRVARHAVLFLDLARSRAALGIVSAFGPLVFKSRLSIHDGKASVRQAYTPAEVERAARSALPGVRVAANGLFVWEMLWRRP